MPFSGPLSWIEIDRSALSHNIRAFRALIGHERRLLVVVKSDAYGHGLIPVAKTALLSSADWLAVFDVREAFRLREAGIEAPILVFGPVSAEHLSDAARLSIRLTVGSPEMVEHLLNSGVSGLHVHLKLETGTNRQGFTIEQLDEIRRLRGSDAVEIEGAYTHYADIEDTTDHSFAEGQLARFTELTERLAEMGIRPPVRHTACSAAALLFESTFFDMVRVGISAYGLWPSKETFVSAHQLGREVVELKPVMTWKTRIAQVKDLKVGDFVGYGRTFRATRPTRLAILPVGYANGYARALSNRAHVLIQGSRAPLCGRVMMNMICVDVTDIPQAAFGDEAVLLGKQGDEFVSAEMLAGWLDTINYEVVTRAEPGGERILR